MPRVDTCKNLLSSYQSNFIQAAINPALAKKSTEKQSYVEALVLNEALKDLDIPRECIIVSTLLGSNVLHPTDPETDERLTNEYVKLGVQMAMEELNVETLDHVVCQIPEYLARVSKNHGELMEKLQTTCDVLESLCQDGQIQSYGFSLPSMDSAQLLLTELVEKTFTPLSKKWVQFASLQLPQYANSGIFLLPEAVVKFQKEREMLLIGDRPLEALLSNGNPFHFATCTSLKGEDIAGLLKSAFNLAIAIEKKYREQIRSELKQLDLPPEEDVAWAHILANQHRQFDNLQVWKYVRETQIYPRLDATVKAFSKYEETKKLGFAYSMAMNQLLKCFTGSVELIDGDRAADIMNAWKEVEGLLPSDKMSIEEVAVMAALSSGIDITLLEEQLPTTSSLPFTHTFSSRQLQQISILAQPYLHVKK
ncbi:hypothetical protein CCR75_002825 [Bremia lactucae]|uniref:NADP-dependent oxidoreductase domain-containing protein n=1 Tax=Bremia lactucae TaxID=4779 RepID=A0A976FMU7_BRELC|nr:hypothetical protein CCR75_002825 [Bremia lactucae]